MSTESDMDCVKCGEWLEGDKTVCTGCGWNNEVTQSSMDSTGVEQQIKVRCNTCRGSGREVAGEGHDFPCFDCNGFGFTKEVFCLKPAPKSLREQLESCPDCNGAGKIAGYPTPDFCYACEGTGVMK